MRGDVADRLWSRVDRSGGPDACWLWTGATDPAGRGALRVAGRRHTAPRVAWTLTHGDPGAAFVHTSSSCNDQRRCCNPTHLELGRPGRRRTYGSRRALAEELFSHLDRSAGPRGCWPWTGPLTAQGYGRIQVGPYRQALAHRVAWQLAHGNAAGGIVRHRCPTRACCNPAHLALVRVRRDGKRRPSAPFDFAPPSAPRVFVGFGQVDERRPAWQADAACRDHPTRWWFPDRGESSARAEAI